MMSTAMPESLTAKAKGSSLSSNIGWLLQRKCACGGSPGLSGECVECKKSRLQKKLTIGASNDPLEQEADRVADQVIAMSSNSSVSSTPLHIQRFTGQTSGETGVVPASVDRVLASPGKSLDATLQRNMGQRFGHDFSQVRVHTGTNAEDSARDVSAHAYTVGNNIVFGAGRFSPETQEGQRLIAHELTHVLQQSAASGISSGQTWHGKNVQNRGVVSTLQRDGDDNAQKDGKSSKSQLSLKLTEPDYLGLKKPFIDRNALQSWDPNSALSVWRFNFDFFKRFGFSDLWAGKAANLTAPLAIDFQLKASNPTWWDITDTQLNTTSRVAPIPIFEFDAQFRNWKPFPFLKQ